MKSGKTCRNGLHQKPQKRGPCVECLRAKEERRNLRPGRQEAMNEAHKAWREKNTPDQYGITRREAA